MRSPARGGLSGTERAGGATTALVACRGDDAYPVPRALYESVGFTLRIRYLTFVRGQTRV